MGVVSAPGYDSCFAVAARYSNGLGWVVVERPERARNLNNKEASCVSAIIYQLFSIGKPRLMMWLLENHQRLVETGPLT